MSRSKVAHDNRTKREEPALIAQEIGAEVIRGPVRYPGHLGEIEVDGVDIGEYPCELKDQEVVVIVAPLNAMQEMPIFCGLCGTRYDGDECPTCRAERQEAKKVIEDRLRRDREEKVREELVEVGELDGLPNMLREFGLDCWQLVSTIVVDSHGETIFISKRPKEE